MPLRSIFTLAAGPAADRLIHEEVLGYRWDAERAAWVAPDGTPAPADIPAYSTDDEASLFVEEAMQVRGYLSLGGRVRDLDGRWVVSYYQPGLTLDMDEAVVRDASLALARCRSALLALEYEQRRRRD